MKKIWFLAASLVLPLTGCSTAPSARTEPTLQACRETALSYARKNYLAPADMSPESVLVSQRPDKSMLATFSYPVKSPHDSYHNDLRWVTIRLSRNGVPLQSDSGIILCESLRGG